MAYLARLHLSYWKFFFCMDGLLRALICQDQVVLECALLECRSNRVERPPGVRGPCGHVLRARFAPRHSWSSTTLCAHATSPACIGHRDWGLQVIQSTADPCESFHGQSEICPAERRHSFCLQLLDYEAVNLIQSLLRKKWIHRKQPPSLAEDRSSGSLDARGRKVASPAVNRHNHHHAEYTHTTRAPHR